MAILAVDIKFTRGQGDGPDTSLRAMSALTSSYVVSTNTLDNDNGNEVTVTFQYTKGVGTGLQAYFEESEDGVRWDEYTRWDSADNKLKTFDPIIAEATSTRSLRLANRKRYFRVWVKSLGTPDATDQVAVFVKPHWT